MEEVAVLLLLPQKVCQPHYKVTVLQARNSDNLIWFAKQLAKKAFKIIEMSQGNMDQNIHV